MRSVLHAVERAVAKVSADAPCLVALTTQRGTTVLVDENDDPLTAIVSWQDRRPGGVAEWFREHAPDVASATVRQVSVASLLMHEWTGQWAEHPATRAATALGTPTDDVWGPLECRTHLFAGGSVVVAVGGDKNCELVGAGASEPGRRAVSFGTALSMGTLIPSNAPVTPGTFRTPSAFRGLDTIEVGLPAGGVMAHSFGGPRQRVCLPPVDGVMCVPYFGGSLLDPGQTGRFVGLDTRVDMEQLYAAWLESLVLELAYSRERLAPGVGPIGLCGGGATQQFAEWLSAAMQADVVDLSSSECGVFGAALLAMHSTGGDASSLMRPQHQLVQPSYSDRWQVRLAQYARLVDP